MRKEAAICDVCEKRLAVTKCRICNRDLCEACKNIFEIKIECRSDSIEAEVDNLCESCYLQLGYTKDDMVEMTIKLANINLKNLIGSGIERARSYAQKQGYYTPPEQEGIKRERHAP